MYPPVVEAMTVYSVRPGDNGDVFDVTEEKSLLDAVQDALGVDKLRVISTGGDSFQASREQWDDANNVVAIEPGVVVALREEHPHQRQPAQGGHRGHRDRGRRARQGPRRLPLHDLPAPARRALGLQLGRRVGRSWRCGYHDATTRFRRTLQEARQWTTPPASPNSKPNSPLRAPRRAPRSRTAR